MPEKDGDATTDPEWKVEVSSSLRKSASFSGTQRRALAPVSTFGGATRFSDKSSPLCLKTSAPAGSKFYGRNELYGTMSCLQSRKPGGRVGKGKRTEFWKTNGGSDLFVGPGSHVVTGAVLSQTGRKSAIDGNQFCDFTIKSKAGLKSIATPSVDLLYQLPSTLQGNACPMGTSERKSFTDEGPKPLDRMYDPKDPQFGGSKEFLKTTFNTDRRFRGLFGGGDQSDRDRDIYYGKVVLSRDDWMSQSRASSMGKQLTDTNASTHPKKSPYHLGPGTYEAKKYDPNAATYNKYFRQSLEWKEEWEDSLRASASVLSNTNYDSGRWSSLNGDSQRLHASQRSLP
jgi:hypothetical protein